MVDSARYIIAVMLLALLPPALFFWFLIHPLVRVWRSLGTAWSYLLVGLASLALMTGLFLARDRLLVVDYGFDPRLAAAALVAAAGAAAITVRRSRQLTMRILLGVQELSPRGGPGRLLTGGIYGRIRHPRYIELTLWTLAYALFVNYLAIWVMFALSLPALYLVVLLEERELRERFGAEYEAYCRRVPRFLPRRAAPGED